MANNAKHPQVPLLLTRPLDGARAFLASLPAEIIKRTTPILSPLIAISPLTPTIPQAGFVIFTSATSIKFAGEGQARRAFCVGANTTAKAKEHGWDAVELGQTADELVANLIDQAPEGPMLHLSGLHTRGNITERLTSAGVPTRNIALYDQTLCNLTSDAQKVLRGDTPVIVPLFSPRTACHFKDQMTGSAPLHIVALSRAVANELHSLSRQSLAICAEPTRDTMAEQVKKHVLDLTLG